MDLALLDEHSEIHYCFFNYNSSKASVITAVDINWELLGIGKIAPKKPDFFPIVPKSSQLFQIFNFEITHFL